MKIDRRLPPLLFALCLSLWALPTIGGPAAGSMAMLPLPEARTVRDEISLSEAVSRVKREYGGRILEAETREQDGRRVHVIKVLTREGRVRTVRIPAEGEG
jgi:uncharacterized membrane protein YkoI